LDKKALLVLIDLLIRDQLAKIDIPEGPQGPRGLRGRDGNDFRIEDHSEQLIAFIQEHSNIVLTSEQIESLQGRDGKDGTSVTLEEVLPSLTDSLQEKIQSMREELKLKFEDLTEAEIDSIRGPKGRDGRDGESFVFEDHEKEIEEKISIKLSEIQDTLKLKLSDLTEEERLSLKGSRGQRGKAGRDFIFEENAENINNLIQKYIDEKTSDLKLKFSELEPEDIEAIRGPKGRDGRDGVDFIFEDHSIEIQNRICEYIDSVKDYFKLQFSDLTDEEKEGLKLKFSDLSEEERLSLKGSRGQRGKAGVDGVDGKDGSTWIAGEGVPLTDTAKENDLYLDTKDCSVYKFSNDSWTKVANIRGARGIPGQIGLSGKNGRDGIDGVDGRNGRDGKDAPYVVDISIDTRKDKEFKIVFEMSNGQTIETNYVDFPATIQNFYYSTGIAGSGGGGSGTANPTEFFDEGISVGTAEKLNFIGPNVTAVKVGDTVNVTITDADTDTNTTDLIVQDEGVDVVTTNKIDFVGPNVSVSTTGGKAVVTISDTDTNTTDLIVQDEGTSVLTTNTIDFQGAGVSVSNTGGKAVVTINGGGSANLEIQDEGNTLTTSVQKINFIGPYITARQKVTINEWNPLSNVEPNMLDYQGNGVSDEIEVYVDVPDSSILRDISCDPSVYVGAFVIIDSSEVARNAIADSYNNSNVVGLVESKESSTKCTVRVSGISSAIYTGLDPSLDYFLSDSVAGQLSSTVPTTSGHIKLKLGQSFGTNKFLFLKGERVVRL